LAILPNQTQNGKMTFIADISDGNIKIPIELQKRFPSFGSAKWRWKIMEITIRYIQKKPAARLNNLVLLKKN